MKQSTYTTIGAFVLGALVLAAAGVAFMGKNSSREGEVLFETYLEETVQGISEGSPVKYRGIPVGTVRSVEFAMMHYRDAAPDSPDRRRAFRYSRIVFSVKAPGFDDTDRFIEMIREHIGNGLHVYSKAQGITGLSYLDLDFDDNGAKDIPVPWEPEYIYVPAAPSLAKTLTDVVQGLSQEIHSFSQVKDAVTNLAAHATTLVDAANGTIGKIDAGLEGVPELVASATGVLASADALLQSLEPAAEGLGPAVESVRTLADSASAELDAVSPALREAAGDIARTAAELSLLAEELRADPSAILHGEEKEHLE